MKENSREEDIKIVEKLINTMKSDRTMFEEDKSKEIYTFFINSLEHILSDYKRVLKENEQLKNDIENMYAEEVVIDIIEGNFNLCRNEVLELLGSEE